MGRSIAALLLLVTIPSTLASGQTTAVISHNANLRPTPSTARAPIRMLPTGEAVALVTMTPVNGYYHVRTARGEDGWVHRLTIKIGVAARSALAASPPAPPQAPPAPAPPSPSSCGPGIEIVVDPSCPAVGTSRQLVPYAPDSDAGLRNMAKRHVPDSACTTATLTLDDVRSLQNYIDNTFADARTTKTTFAPTRSLKNIPTFDGMRSEGDSVSLSAYLIVAKDEGSESVNCGGHDGTDIHISLGPKSPHPTEYDGIIAEMIPQLPRPAGWDSTTVNRLAGKQVLVIGGLTYDNEHLVNDNPASPKPGQPKRFSLWEVHPITAFYVCPAGDGCDPAQLEQWATLTDWAGSHPVTTTR
jgi:hypothetical protein